MANKSVLELAVQTGQWDAGLKKAKTALQNFTDASGGLQKALTEDSASMQKFVQMMGRTDSQAKTAKGRLNDYKSTIEQLIMQYNQMNEAQKRSIGQDYLRSIDQLKQKYQDVNKQIQEMNRSLAETPDIKAASGSGIFSGLSGKMEGALAVFGGNMMTKAAGAIASLGTEMFNSVQQGIELAKQGEGIRIAFERLGRGDILQGLREATHGTVTDLELMKAAVKFNDFKLPVEELGTMLAFAQQKAKDTGQSVDYMVDSIVTGLGRKSLMILDNLGLSATEVKDKMKETGDMTKAVGQIIREQMAKAGDYVETAADRQAQATVNVQNKLEELGRKMQPLAEEGASMWNSIKLGGLSLISSVLDPMIARYTKLGLLMQQYGNLGGSGKVGQMLKQLGSGGGRAESVYQQQMLQFWKYINPREDYLTALSRWRKGERSDQLQQTINQGRERFGIDDRAIRAQVDAAKKQLKEYQEGAKGILNPIKPLGDIKETSNSLDDLKKKLKDLEEQRKKAIAAGDTDLSKNLLKEINQTKADIRGLDPNALKTTTTKKEQTEIQKNQEKINKLSQEYAKLGDESTAAARERQAEIQKEIALLQQRNGLLGLRAEQAQGRFMLRPSDMKMPTAMSSGLLGNPFAADDKAVDIKGSLGLQLDPSVLKDAEKDSQTYIDQLVKGAKQTEKAWGMAGQAVQGIGSAFAMIDDPAAKVAGTVMQAIASVALGFAMASKSADTVASGWGWLAWLGAGAAAMATTISTIHSLTGYASGGVIKGNSYSGDNIMGMVDGGGGGLVGLNAGEIVLNKAQTASVANELTNNQPRAMRVNGRISGHDIVLAADRSLVLEGKGHIVTWK